MIYCNRQKFQDAIQASYKTVKSDLKKVANQGYEFKRPFQIVKDNSEELFWRKKNSFGVLFPLWQLNNKFNSLEYEMEKTNKHAQLHNSGIYYAKKQILYIKYKLTGKSKYLNLELLTEGA